MSDRAPKCPFCGATMPTADVDLDATPARGVSAATALPIPPPPAPAASPGPSGAEPLGPFDRVRPLDASGRTWLGFTAEGGGRAAVIKALGDADGQAATLWTALTSHTSVVRAAGLLEGDGGPRVVFEYVAPDAHSRRVQGRSAFERRLRRDTLAFPDVLRLGVLVCRGLEHTYAGGLLGHGNLKPSNLLLGLDGGLRVSEPGLLGIESALELAPERFDGAPADERSDVYSLGVLLFRMTSGRPPFDTPAGGADGAARHRETLRHLHQDALVPRLDSPLAALLERCLQKKPAARFPAVAALRTELEDLLRRETGLLPALPPPGEAKGWERAQQGLALLAVGRAEPAVRAFDEALVALPPTASVRAVRATALNVLRQHEEAVHAAEQAIAIDPQYAPAWRQKGESLAAIGRRDEALDALEQAAVIAPRDAGALVSLGRLLGTVGRLPQALSAYDRAVAADAEHVDVWLERGITLAAAGLRADAAGAFLRFLDLSPSGHPARRKAEELLREVRGGTEAPAPAPPPPAPLPPPLVAVSEPLVAPFEPLVPVLDPPAPPPQMAPPPPPAPPAPPVAASPPERYDVVGLNERGVALFREGRLDQAILALDRALALDSRRAATLSNRAAVLFRAGRAEEGLADQEKALAREPRSAGSWLSKARIERALGRLSQARRSLLDLLSLQSPPDGRLMEQARSLFADLERQGVPPGPKTALGFLLGGVQHAEAGRLQEAVADFDEALGRDALLATGWLFKGDALLALGRVAEAAQAYDEGLAADPGEVRLLTGLGRARARLGDLDVATAVLTRALELADAESMASIERLLSAVATRRNAVPVPAPAPSPTPPPAPEGAPAPEAAADDLREPHPAPTAVMEEPTPEEPPLDEAADWANKGEAALKASRFEDAVAAFDEALQHSPRLRDAWIGRGLALKRLGRFDDAISSFVKVLQDNPGDIEALYQKAGSEDQAGRPAEAVRSYERFMSAAPAGDPRHESARVQHARLLESQQAPPPAPPPPPPADPVAVAAALAVQGKHAEALDVLDRARAAGTDHGPLWIARGDNLRALGRKEEATAAFDEAIKRAPREPLAWIKKGDALDAAGLYPEAVACYDQAVELHPRHLGAWNSKGVCLTRLDRIEEALQCFTRALELDPRFALARFNKGAAEDRLGHGEEALRSYQAFLSLAPPNLRAQIQYAQKRMQTLRAPRA